MELIEYFPEVMQEMDDVQVYAKAVQALLLREELAIENLYNDQFLSIMTETGLGKLEKKLNIHTLDTDSIEDRRMRLFSLYIKALPYTETTLRAYLDQICGTGHYDLLIDTQECLLAARIALTRKAQVQTIEKYIDDVVPMNMTIVVSLMYNQWISARKRTWGEASKFTCMERKEEVIE